MDIITASITTISVFGGLCSIYSAGENRWKDQNYRRSLLLSIQALESLKDTHTYTQKLREHCEAVIKESQKADQPFSDTKRRLELFRDNLDFVINTNAVYGNEDFNMISLSDSVITDIRLRDILTKVSAVAQAVNIIAKETKTVSPYLTDITESLMGLRQDTYSPFQLNTNMRILAEKTMEPARQMLLSSDMAIMKSITVINFFSKGLL